MEDTMRRLEVDSPDFTIEALREWWHTGPEGEAFAAACEKLNSRDPQVRAAGADEASYLLASAGASWNGIVSLLAYSCDDGRDLPPY